MSCIYKITSPSEKIYIGQTINFNKRCNHYKLLDCKNQIKLYNSLLKYGYSNHIFEVIEECLFEELNIKERYWQDYYDVLNKGLNCVLTQTDILPKVMSEETKLKISNSKTGNVIISKEHKLILKNLYTNKKRSVETCNKISKSKSGKKLSSDHILNLKLSHVGYKFSEERKLKCSLNSKQSKKIKCLITGYVYKSITECANFYKISHRTLIRKIKNQDDNYKHLQYH